MRDSGDFRDFRVYRRSPGVPGLPEVARIFYQRQVWYPDSLKERPSYIAEKADVFSIGILLFTMFFGTPPFRQNDPQREPMLHYLCSNDLANAEVFF